MGDDKEKKSSHNAKTIHDLQCTALYFNRELSWLEFNARVLENALTEDSPVLEQVKFLSIFHSNLDEFFMVRVANVLRKYENGIAITTPDRMSSAKLLAEIRRKVQLMRSKVHNHWKKSIYPKLLDRGVKLLSYEELNDKQKRFLDAYFHTEIYPILTPQAIDLAHPFPNISNGCINFIVSLEGDDGHTRFARVRCPNNVPRFIFVPRGKETKNYRSLALQANFRDSDIVLLEDIIANHLSALFYGNKVTNYGLFRVTRSAEFEVDEDESDNLLETIKDLVFQRHFGDVVRLETTHGMATELTDFLVAKLHLRPVQVYRVKELLAFSDLIALYGLDRPALKDAPFQARMHPAFSNDNVFGYLRDNDIFLHHPYDSFKPVTEFIRQASEDPLVAGIKIILYRVGKDSPIIKALIVARQSGKQVTAVVELKARFDEERNITWATELEKAGVNVVYGLAGFKIHAKLCLVVRKDVTGLTRYVHIATGNYNAMTSKMYTDMGIMTSNKAICADVTDVFNAVTGYAKKTSYRKLWVSPVTMRQQMLKHIHKEIRMHNEHGDGEIILKCNQLVDKFIIRALYAASQAGVRIYLIIRGVCCLVPNVPDVSENIKVISIVGRFLEHARVYYFRNNGKPIIYMGSADIMPRNFDRRVEVCVPILSNKYVKQVHDILHLQIEDTRQAWVLDNCGEYARIACMKNVKPVNSQETLLLSKP